MKQQPKHTLIAGPTASGKSELAIRIAQKNGGTIVNADALQVYECYEVLTARPSKQDLEQATHALYGHIENPIPYSTGAWLRDVQDIFNSSSDIPLIFVGGTGLYFQALLNGLADIPEASADIRAEVSMDLEQRGLQSLVDELAEVDPEIIERIDLQNPRRVMRAIEVFRQTKKPLSCWQRETPAPLIELKDCDAFVVMPEVDVSNSRIEKRFDQMLALGAIQEVADQIEPWIEDLPANKALGAKPIAQYLMGEISLDQARSESIVSTKQYAKRQRTWFRSRMKSWKWIFPSESE